MELSAVYTKTSKGVMQITNKTKRLPREINHVLTLVDGKSTLVELLEKSGRLSESKLQKAIIELTREGLVRVLYEGPVSQFGAPPDAANAIVVGEVDHREFYEAEAKAREMAEEGKRIIEEAEALERELEAEVKSRAQAKEKNQEKAKAENDLMVAKARADADAALTQQRIEAEKKALVAAEKKVEAETAARIKAEALAQQRAEEEAKLRSEAQAKLIAEQKARAAAEAEVAAAKQRAQAAANAQADAEAKAKEQAAQWAARAEAEAKLAKAQAEKQAKEQIAAEERARAEIEAQLRAEREARAMAEAQMQAERERAEEEAKARAVAEARAANEAELAKAAAQAQAEKQAKERIAAEERARAEIEAQLLAEREARAMAEAQMQAERERAEEEAKARAEAEARAAAEAQSAKAAAQAQAEKQARERVAAEERARAEIEAQLHAEREARAIAEAQMQAERERAEEEAKARADAEARAAAEAQSAKAAAQAQAEKQAKERIAAEERARAEIEAQLHAEREARAIAEAQMQAERERAEEEANARADAEARAAIEAEVAKAEVQAEAERQAIARIEAEELARSETAARLKAEADAKIAQQAAEAEAKKLKQTREQLNRAIKAQQKKDAKERAKSAAAERKQLKDQKRRLRHAPKLIVKKLSSSINDAVQMAVDKQSEWQSKRLKRRTAKAKARVEQQTSELAETDKEQKVIVEIKNASASTPTRRKPKVIIPVKKIGAVLIIVMLLASGVLHIITLDFLVPKTEKLASALIGEPVAIRSIRVSFFPAPHLALKGVLVGEAKDIKIDVIRVTPNLRYILDPKKSIKVLEINSAPLNLDGLARIPKWLGTINQYSHFNLERIYLSHIYVSIGKVQFPLINIDAKAIDGKFTTALVTSQDNKVQANVIFKEGAIDFDVVAKNIQPMFGKKITLDELRVKATSTNDRLILSKIEAWLHDGVIEGHGELVHDKVWSLVGELKGKHLNLQTLLPNFSDNVPITGKLNLIANYALQAVALDGLHISPRLSGTFDIANGSLAGIDFMRAIRSSVEEEYDGETRFKQFSGTFSPVGQSYQFRKLKMSSGKMDTTGFVEVLSNGKLGGQIQTELLSRVPHKVRLALSGELGTPKLRRAP